MKRSMWLAAENGQGSLIASRVPEKAPGRASLQMHLDALPSWREESRLNVNYSEYCLLHFLLEQY